MLRHQDLLRWPSSHVARPSVTQRGQRLFESPRWMTCVNSWNEVRAHENVPRSSHSGETAVTTGPKHTPRAGYPWKPVERTEKSSHFRKTSIWVTPGVWP